MKRFYLRIYLALFASLAVFAVLAGVTAGLFRLFDEPAARYVGGVDRRNRRAPPAGRSRPRRARVRACLLERTQPL